jgi:hypothetical protein
MDRIPDRHRLRVVLGVGVAAVIVMSGAVYLLGGGSPPSTPEPTGSPSPSASPTDPTSSPEGAVRAFFEAFAEARPENDASLVLPFATSDDSPAYLSVFGFLEGQKALGRGAVIDEQRLENVEIELDLDRATVSFTYVEGGYLIDLDSGEPINESSTLPPARIVAEVHLEGSIWRVHEYESFL